MDGGQNRLGRKKYTIVNVEQDRIGFGPLREDKWKVHVVDEELEKEHAEDFLESVRALGNVRQ
jgi:hypothetical protein